MDHDNIHINVVNLLKNLFKKTIYERKSGLFEISHLKIDVQLNNYLINTKNKMKE